MSAVCGFILSILLDTCISQLLYKKDSMVFKHHSRILMQLQLVLGLADLRNLAQCNTHYSLDQDIALSLLSAHGRLKPVT